jgi:hypothetical protein
MADGWTESDSLGMVLRDALTDDYLVLAEPTVHGCAMDALVVGPQGLFVLHARSWEGDIQPAQSGAWHGQLASGRHVHYPNPAGEVRRATSALRAFLRDEFPSLRPSIRHFLVLTNPNARVTTSTGVTQPPTLSVESAVEEIAATEPPPDGAALEGKIREELAVALRDRKLTASQRVSEPFIFRSGGLFGSGRKVWTLRAAVRHMDKHPQDGIYHLRNGTLAQWLSDQGAEHLAEMARDAVRQGEPLARAALETFLIGTGLIGRPRLSVRPKRINLGFILSGETNTTRLHVSKGRGRGYLFGTLQTSEPWLDVQPRALKKCPLESVVSVSANTDILRISPDPYQAEITVESSASEDPVAIPVRFRIVGMPSRFNRCLLRPLSGFITAGLLGAGVGWCLGRWGLATPSWLGGFTTQSLSSPGVWAVLVGLLWATLGGIRGAAQRLAWPTSYAIQHWFLRTLSWSVALLLIAWAGLLSWRHFQPWAPIAQSTRQTVLLSALACAILPGVLYETWWMRSRKDSGVDSVGQSLLRPMVAAAIGIALALLVAASAPGLSLILRQFHRSDLVASVQGWAADGATRVGTGVDDAMDDLYLRYYDRRAPVQATPVGPDPVEPPTAEDGRP